MESLPLGDIIKTLGRIQHNDHVKPSLSCRGWATGALQGSLPGADQGLTGASELGPTAATAENRDSGPVATPIVRGSSARQVSCHCETAQHFQDQGPKIGHWWTPVVTRLQTSKAWSNVGHWEMHDGEGEVCARGCSWIFTCASCYSISGTKA